MISKESKMLLVACDGLGNIKQAFHLIRDVQQMTEKDLDEEIREAFGLYVEQEVDEDMRIKFLTCRYMFIEDDKLGVDYLSWNRGVGYHPSKKSLLSLVLEYSDNKIKKTYDRFS